jgi:hypothetical protein
MSPAAHEPRPLFDVERTTTARCEACGATREPTEALALACMNDQDRDAGFHRPRPRACLNRYRPEDARIPF